jgi:hypothetical protein
MHADRRNARFCTVMQRESLRTIKKHQMQSSAHQNAARPDTDIPTTPEAAHGTHSAMEELRTLA